MTNLSIVHRKIGTFIVFVAAMMAVCDAVRTRDPRRLQPTADELTHNAYDSVHDLLGALPVPKDTAKSRTEAARMRAAISELGEQAGASDAPTQAALTAFKLMGLRTRVMQHADTMLPLLGNIDNDIHAASREVAHYQERSGANTTATATTSHQTTAVDEHASVAATTTGDAAFWDYGCNGCDWDKKGYAMCHDGQRQSPIDINTTTLRDTNELFNVAVSRYETGQRCTLENKHGRELSVTTDEDGNCNLGAIVVNGVASIVKRVSFHMGSEHRVNGETLALEMQVYHERADGGTGGRHAISVLWRLGKSCDPWLDTVMQIRSWPTVNQHNDRVRLPEVNLAAFEALRAGPMAYGYTGSSTQPPCDEPVSWTVVEHVNEMCAGQLTDARMALAMRHNNRNVVAVGALTRDVFRARVIAS